MSEQEQEQRLTVDGRTVVSYYGPGPDARWADRAVARVPVAEAVPAILVAMPGWDFVPDTDDDPVAGAALDDALIDAGAVLRRHALGYTYALAGEVDPAWAEPVLPDGVRLASLDAVSADLVDVFLRAFPPTHVDHQFLEADPRSELTTLLAGVQHGEVLPGTAQVVRDGHPIAALIVTRFAGQPPYGGPWITEVFRDPDEPAARGLGSVLIRRALALLAASREPALSLAVTAGNPAAQRYEALGFTRTWDARRLRLPGGDSTP